MSRNYASLILVVAVSCWLSGGQTPSVQASGLSSLSGYVYVDQNFDGVRDPNVEWVLPDVQVLLAKVGSPSDPVATVTDDTGFYQFSGLDTGTYRIIESAIPAGYLNTVPGLGHLVGLPPASWGEVVYYDQQNGILPQFMGIELPATPTLGVDYNFGQLWTGKAWYLTDGGSGILPPGGNPPVDVPEPATWMLLAVGTFLLTGRKGLLAFAF